MQAEIRKQTETYLDQILGNIQVQPELLNRVKNELKPIHHYINKIELQRAIKSVLQPKEIELVNSILFVIKPSFLPTVTFTQRQQILDAYYVFEEAYQKKFPSRPMTEIHTILVLIAKDLSIDIDSFYSLKHHNKLNKLKGITELYVSTKNTKVQSKL